MYVKSNLQGNYHAVFTDNGENFPGFILKKVNFYPPPTTTIYAPSTGGTVATTTTTTATIETATDHNDESGSAIISLAGLEDFEVTSQK